MGKQLTKATKMNEIECEICCICFDESSRRPRILSCGHTFCASCLKKFLKDKFIICPNCQQTHEVEDVDKLLVNYTLVNLLRSSDNTGNNTKTTNKCAEHGYDLNFFCKKHTKWICRDCTVIDHKPLKRTENCSSQNILQCSTECLNREDCHVLSKKEVLELKRHDVLHLIDVEKEKMMTKLEGQYQGYIQFIESKLKFHDDIKNKLMQFSKENDTEVQVLKEKQQLMEFIPLTIKGHESQFEGFKEKVNAAVSIEVLDSVKEIVSKEFLQVIYLQEQIEYQIGQTKANAKKEDLKWKELDMYQSEIKDLHKHLEEKNDTIKKLESKLVEKDAQIDGVKEILSNEEQIMIQEKMIFIGTNTNSNCRMAYKGERSIVDELEFLLLIKDDVSEGHQITSIELQKLYDSYKNKCEKLETNYNKNVNTIAKLEDQMEEMKELLREVSSVTPQNVYAIRKYLGTASTSAVYVTAEKCFDCRTKNRRYGKLFVENHCLLLNQMTEEIPPAKSIILQVCKTGAELLDGWREEIQDGRFQYFKHHAGHGYRGPPLRERPPAYFLCPMKQLLLYCKNVFFTLKVAYLDKDAIHNLIDPLTVLNIKLYEGCNLDKFRREALIRSCSSYAGETWEGLSFHNLRYPHDSPNDNGEMINCMLSPTFGLEYGGRNFQPFQVKQGQVYAYDKAGFSICFFTDSNNMTKQVLLGCVESDYMVIRDAAHKYGERNIQFCKTYVSLESMW